MPQGGGSSSSNLSNTEGPSKQIFRLIREGVSWSGHERNTCFLNSGSSGRFLNISEASGFAFPDDGRALILTDWDGDGDLDSFISNRNAPQVRFLRNDIPQSDRNWISLRLKGTGKVNSDAIGARVKLNMKNQLSISRSLRAGDGFQAQASKQLHFGLGSDAEIESVEITWPNGDLTKHTGLAVNSNYTITYGKKDVESFHRKEQTWPNPLPKLELTETSSGAFTALNSKLPAPSILYTDFEGKKKVIDTTQLTHPILINIWASWCLPCHAELKDFQKNQAAIDKAGLKILALSVDGVDGQAGAIQKAIDLKNQLNPHFEMGMATNELLTKINILHDTFFEKRSKLVVPTSILINANGQVIGFYEGKVSSDEILSSLSNANDQKKKWSSLPFKGGWLAEPIELLYSKYANTLLDHGFTQDAIHLYESKQWLEKSKGVERFLSKLGEIVEKSDDPKKALTYFKRVAQLRPKDTQIQISLGDKYSAVGDSANAVIYYQKALDLEPDRIDTRYNLGIMLNRIGKQEQALTEFEKVLNKDPKHTMALANSAAYYMNRKKLHIAILYLDRVLESKPDFHTARFQLGRLHETVGDNDSAIKTYKELLKIDPTNQSAPLRLKLLNESK